MKIVKHAAAGLLAGAAFLPTGAALAAWEVNLPVGVTELSREIHGLHMLIFWICVIIAAAVFGMMIYSIVKFRHSQGAGNSPAVRRRALVPKARAFRSYSPPVAGDEPPDCGARPL